jgi:hypothetical protein
MLELSAFIALSELIAMIVLLVATLLLAAVAAATDNQNILRGMILGLIKIVRVLIDRPKGYFLITRPIQIGAACYVGVHGYPVSASLLVLWLGYGFIFNLTDDDEKGADIKSKIKEKLDMLENLI